MRITTETRESFAQDHLDGLESVEGLLSVAIFDASEDWLTVIFSFQTMPETDAETVFKNIEQGFATEATSPFSGLGGIGTQCRDGNVGRFPVEYPLQ